MNKCVLLDRTHLYAHDGAVAIDGAALKLLRERCGATRTQYAQDLGISLQYLCDIEGGRRQLKRRPDLIKKMAERLDVPQYMIEQRRTA